MFQNILGQQLCGEQMTQHSFLKLRLLLQGINEILGRSQPDPVPAGVASSVVISFPFRRLPVAWFVFGTLNCPAPM